MSIENPSYQRLKQEKDSLEDKIINTNNIIGTLDDLSTTDKSSIVAAINETFTSVSNGKANVASAITDKGVITAADATFSTMATNISNIPTGITPAGTINIETNGTHDVTNYATANVQISGGINPTLINKNISNNGIYNATDDNADGYSSVNVNVQPTNYRGGTFTLETDTYSITKVSDLDADILNHRSDNTFFMAVFPKFVPQEPCSVGAIRGNLSFIGGKYGNSFYQTSSQAGTGIKGTRIDTAQTDSLCNIWVDSDGLYINSATSYKWRAGNYHYICAW